MATYLVKRHGSNAANQSMTPEAILGWIEAKDRDAAIEAATARWTCYANQHFEVKPASRCGKAECAEANEADFWKQQQEAADRAEFEAIRGRA